MDKSETLYPKYIKNEGFDNYFVDVGGLCDSGGKLIDIIVALLNKKVFAMAKKVRFLFPMSLTQINDMRGKPIIN